MPSPSVDMMWQEIRLLKGRVCNLEKAQGNSIQTGLLQFRVGDMSIQAYFSKGNIADVALPSNNSTQLVIKDNSIKADSVMIFLDGSIVYKDRGDVTSYSIIYFVDKIIINKPVDDPFRDNQLYLVRYEYNT